MDVCVNYICSRNSQKLEEILVFKVEVGVKVEESEYHLRKVWSVQIDISYPKSGTFKRNIRKHFFVKIYFPLVHILTV